jgi:peptidoglycan/xylan/chitin deacetylase (PgdA/CDA1 family)
MEFPVLVISIDTELLWGVAYVPDHPAFKLMRDNPLRTREAIYEVLSLFEKHDVAATWAVVGHLFLDACDGLHHDLYDEQQSWHSFDPGSDIRSDPLYYGRDLIEAIIGNKVEHEIGYHSFSHVRFSACTEAVAEAEIVGGLKLAKELGIRLRSFVFPENEINHLNIVKKYDFAIFRGRTNRRNVEQDFLVRGLSAAIDKVSLSSAVPVWRDGLWETNANMWFDGLRTPFALSFRAAFGLDRVIRSRKVFHLSFHPYDLLLRPSLLKCLDDFLARAATKRDRGLLRIMTMGSLATQLDKERDRLVGTESDLDRQDETHS